MIKYVIVEMCVSYINPEHSQSNVPGSGACRGINPGIPGALWAWAIKEHICGNLNKLFIAHNSFMSMMEN